MDGWKMDLSGCEKWMDVESGKWKVESGAVPDLTYVTFCEICGR